MSKGADIETRLIKFAAEIVKSSNKLPRHRSGRHIADQLLRSGTSPAPNYAEARAAESKRDFVHKLKVAVKELNETQVWLKIVQDCDMLDKNLLCDLLDECNQLAKILSASINTVRKNMR